MMKTQTNQKNWQVKSPKELAARAITQECGIAAIQAISPNTTSIDLRGLTWIFINEDDAI